MPKANSTINIKILPNMKHLFKNIAILQTKRGDFEMLLF